VILLVPSVAILIAILLHAAACRLPLAFGSVVRFLMIGSICGLAAIVVMVTEYGLTADVVGATLAFAFAAELYLFLFTMMLASVSANILALLSQGPASATDINNIYGDRAMAALRIERLLATGLAQERDGVISLTPRGHAIARLFAELRTAFSHRFPD
jgi:hypothetical protein